MIKQSRIDPLYHFQSCGDIGIAIYPHDGDNVETLLKHADDAMYVAKKQGKGQSQVYSKVEIQIVDNIDK